jgi:molybdopterin synthase catalytic subunit
MISITRDAINITKIVADVEDGSAGGITIFLGSVRDHNENGSVSEIYYEVYKEMAEAKMAQIEAEARKRWPVKKFVAVHRTGKMKVGEVSVAVAVSCVHRKEAFEACRYAIDEIKTRVPIWKKEVSDTGMAWVEGVTPK